MAGGVAVRDRGAGRRARSLERDDVEPRRRIVEIEDVGLAIGAAGAGLGVDDAIIVEVDVAEDEVRLVDAGAPMRNESYPEPLMLPTSATLAPSRLLPPACNWNVMPS